VRLTWTDLKYMSVPFSYRNHRRFQPLMRPPCLYRYPNLLRGSPANSGVGRPASAPLAAALPSCLVLAMVSRRSTGASTTAAAGAGAGAPLLLARFCVTVELRWRGVGDAAAAAAAAAVAENAGAGACRRVTALVMRL